MRLFEISHRDLCVLKSRTLLRPFALLLAGWYKDNGTDALHAWMCVIWYDFFFSFFPFHCSYRISACVCMRVCVRVHVLMRCELVCMLLCVCSPSVLQRWRVQARVRLRSEISQISYCLCSFSIHALWFTTPRASYTNDVAFSDGFLPELKHAFLVTGTKKLLGVFFARPYRRGWREGGSEGGGGGGRGKKKKAEKADTFVIKWGGFFFRSRSVIVCVNTLTLVFVFPQEAA